MKKYVLLIGILALLGLVWIFRESLRMSEKMSPVPDELVPISGPQAYNGYRGYSKAGDDSAVYYLTKSTPCPDAGCVALIPGADAATFVGMTHEYAQDKNHVYLPDQFGNIKILQSADPMTFAFVGYVVDGDPSYGFYARDKSRVYHRYELVVGADPSFHFVLDASGKPTGYAMDTMHVYNAFSAKPLSPEADPKSFVVLSDWYAKDKGHVYSYNPDVVLDGATTVGTLLSDADASTFVLVTNQAGYDAKDINHHFYRGRIVE